MNHSPTPVVDVQTADDERRFGGLQRLYGEPAYRRLRALTVAVVGVGGVGSWVAEALARSGVAGLVLIDLDQVAESNINRQVQALGSTLGQAKVLALRERLLDIHPACDVVMVEQFVDADNWPALLAQPVHVVIDACDQLRAKRAIAAWALRERRPLVCAGAAGGRQAPQQVQVQDLALATHDPLLASLRRQLRRDRRARGEVGEAGDREFGLRCVFSRETTAAADAGSPGAPLSCHGYGSSVMVTATFGMVAAAEALRLLLQPQ